MRAPDIDIPARVDTARFGNFQILTIILCFMVVVMDGFDVQVIGFVAPAILQDWKVDKSTLGAVFVAGLVGLLIGSFALSILADKFGRRPMLIASTLLFSICMLVTASVTNMTELIAIRFLTGIGLGSIMPNALALTGEYTPARRRATILMIVSVGFAVGAVIAGLVCATLIPVWGWHAVFYAGGTVPLIIAVLMYFFLPESLQFLVLRGEKVKVARWYGRLDPSTKIDANTTYRVDELPAKNSPVVELLASGRRKMTLLLWAVNVLNLFNLYFLSNWLPTIVNAAGLPVSTAVIAGTWLQIGGTVGAICMGLIIDRLGFRRVLLPCFTIAAIGIMAIGRPGLSVIPLFVVITIAGFCVIGGQQALNALSASYYPTQLRSTGIGWALGVGRFGAIAGPFLGGEFVRMGLSTDSIFLVLAIPAALSAVLAWSMAKGDEKPGASRLAPELQAQATV